MVHIKSIFEVNAIRWLRGGSEVGKWVSVFEYWGKSGAVDLDQPDFISL